MLTLQKPQHAVLAKKTTPVNYDLWLDINTTDLGIAHFNEFADFMKRSWNIEDDFYLEMYGALSEALTNSAEHGNKWNEDKEIHIHARRDEEYYIVSITDEGDGFNYYAVNDPTHTANREKPSGRGIFIMSHLADKLHFSENGRCATLFFRRGRNF